jgi:hypothetical protein
MHLKGSVIICFWLALTLVGGCAASRLAPPPAGVSLRSGNFVQDYFFAPGFAPAQVSYALGPFKVERSQGVAPETFLPLLQAELTRAWEANGLKISGTEPDCQLTATIHRVTVSGGRLRFLRGKISAHLVASGVISRNGRILFAFRDRLSLDSPVSAGPPAPKETELLLKQISRELAHRLLNEMLLHGLTADAIKRSANTRTRSRGRFFDVVRR